MRCITHRLAGRQKTNLLIASYLFYAAWNPPFVILLWISTVIDWHVAKRLFVEQAKNRRRVLLAVSVIVNLGLLGYFKYGEFLLENFIALAAMAGVEYQPPEWNIILPVGISFYAFQTMAYSLDMYLRRAEPSKSFLDFALFVTFFPQLLAGPIVRPTHLLPQFAKPRVATPTQLFQPALEGTSPVKLMEGLAEDEDVTGTLLVGVAPGTFFGAGGYRAKAFQRYEQESPSQWLGQQLSMLVEPYLAFYHHDYSLFMVIKRQDLRGREGVEFEPDVRRLATYGKDRAARMYPKVEEDAEYARIAQEIWAAGFTPIEEEEDEELDNFYERRAETIDRAIEATNALQERGIEVIFF